METSIELEHAIDIINLNIKNKDTEVVDILNAIGKILANSIYSQISNPPFNKSAMDGYAVNLDNKNIQKRYKVIGTVFAGKVFDKVINKDECVKIMTGAKIPTGINAVIKKEDISIELDYIKLNKDIKIHENICFEGEDVLKGQLLIEAGKNINYADVGILASSGIPKVLVYKKPTIGFISTGDEVIDIKDELIDGKIYNSNKYSILSRLYELGYLCKDIDHADDDIKEMKNKIKYIANKVDVIITTGSVSVGDKDLLDKAILNMGGKILFKKVKIKPGSSVMVSIYEDTLIISLSGNPNAALTTFELLVKPSLEKLSGAKEAIIKKEKAILVNSINKKNNQRRFCRGKFIIENEKQYVYLTQVKSGNGILSSNLNSNCLIEINKGNEALKEGSIVDIIKL